MDLVNQLVQETIWVFEIVSLISLSLEGENILAVTLAISEKVN